MLLSSKACVERALLQAAFDFALAFDFPLALIPSLIRRLLRQRLPGRRIISSPRLDFVVLFTLDFQFAVASVQFGVEGRVAEVVLAAQLGGDLVEGLSQLVELVPHVDDAASGLLCKLAHFSLSGA